MVTLVLVLGLVLAACGQTPSGSTSSGAASPSASGATGSAAASASPSASSSASEEPAASTGSSASPSASSSASGAASPSASASGAASASGSAAASGSAVPSGSPVTALDPIRERGRLVVGVKYDQPLFGFLDPLTNEVDGFDVAIAREVAQQVFGDPNAVEFTESISANRIPYLQNGLVDLVAATMTANEERAQQIEFSDCYYVAGQSLLVRTDSDIQSIDDLAGRQIGTVRGSTSERNITERAPEAQVQLFDNYGTAVQALLANRLEAVTTDDIILIGFQQENADQLKLVGGQFTKEPYAIGVAKGNTELLNEVNTALRTIKENGRWAEIYQQYIPGQPVPELPPQDWRDVQ
jgi:putative glutamine transport system substrate-binding protein